MPAIAVKTALSRAAEPVQRFRIMAVAAGRARFKYLMGLDSVSRDGDAALEARGIEGYFNAAFQPTSPVQPSIHPQS